MRPSRSRVKRRLPTTRRFTSRSLDMSRLQDYPESTSPGRSRAWSASRPQRCASSCPHQSSLPERPLREARPPPRQSAERLPLALLDMPRSRHSTRCTHRGTVVRRAGPRSTVNASASGGKGSHRAGRSRRCSIEAATAEFGDYQLLAEVP